ncbi:MAG: ABC transporter ATP-binding protein [Clostridiales bacterium]|nr:ABC transporter ATP-binding protein [Clostridiales bacterium]
MNESKKLLEINELSISFGGLNAVTDVNFYINSGEIFGLIGPNGAGKTTLFNMITGVYLPTKGNVTFDGKVVSGKKTYQINNIGIARTFQNIRLFREMSAIDNVMLAMNKETNYNLLQCIFGTSKYVSEEKKIFDKAMKLLDFMGIAEFYNYKAMNLPYGQQRKLEIARALASDPKLLLLDEPAAGMNPTETAELADIVRKIREKLNVTILLIEHDMSFVMSLCERIVVLDYGKLIANGTPQEIKNNPKVIAAYLGGE